MIEPALSAANIQSMLQTLRALQSEAAGAQSPVAPLAPGADGVNRAGGAGRTGFADLVKGAVGGVNDLQTRARALQSDYERGADVPLTDVVIGMQKASLAFEATLQVRNKVLKAYEDILNMPV